MIIKYNYISKQLALIGLSYVGIPVLTLGLLYSPLYYLLVTFYKYSKTKVCLIHCSITSDHECGYMVMLTYCNKINGFYHEMKIFTYLLATTFTCMGTSYTEPTLHIIAI